MPVAQNMEAGSRGGILVAPLHFTDGRFTRADLVFSGVDHSAGSYEVLVFLNNPEADDTTVHAVDAGYGGRFSIFGHGPCYGDVGHCDVPERAPDDLRPEHPLTPATKIVTITDALRHVLAHSKHGLETVTLVPVTVPPRRADRRVTPDLFRFDDMTLRTYLDGTEYALPADQEVAAKRKKPVH